MTTASESLSKEKSIEISEDNYKVSGHVLNKSNEAVKGLIVHAVDQDLVGKHDHLGSAVTDGNGNFQISFKGSDFRDILGERHPDLYFRVYKNKKPILDTEFESIKDADEKTPSIILRVDLDEIDVSLESKPEGEIQEKSNFRKKSHVAQYKGTDWKNEVRRESNVTLLEAENIALSDSSITYFAYVNSPMFLEGKSGVKGWTEKGQFIPKDAIFFSGKPWYGSTPQADTYEKIKVTWKKKINVAQYGGADWNNEFMRLSNITVEKAKEIAANIPAIRYFFFTRETLWLTGKAGPGGWSEKGHFHFGDVVFFTGKPWYGSAPQADIYEKLEEPVWA